MFQQQATHYSTQVVNTTGETIPKRTLEYTDGMNVLGKWLSPSLFNYSAIQD